MGAHAEATSSPPTRILLVENDPEAAERVIALARREGDDFELTVGGTLADALKEVERQTFDVLVVDLALPDSQGLDAVELLHLHADDLPIVVFSSVDDQDLAAKAIERGAQDYLVKGDRVDESHFARSVRYAVERQKLITALREQSLLDELTGLYNRRGFFTLADQQLHLADREEKPVGLLLLDLDGFKAINDRYGHPEGDRALRTVARLLQQTFRASDILGRLGGDEFIVLALPGSTANLRHALDRLRHNLRIVNEDASRAYRLRLSVGVHWCERAATTTLEDLLEAADRALYLEKRRKQNGEDSRRGEK